MCIRDRINFEGRKFWRDVLGKELGGQIDQTIDFWDGRNLHGKIDAGGNVIHLSETNLKEITPNMTPPHKALFAVDFVADAFSDLQTHFMKAASKGLLSVDGLGDIRTMTAKRGWTSVHQSYNNYKKELYNALVEFWFKRDRREEDLVDFKSFVKAIMQWLVENNGTAFLSLSGLVASRHTSNAVSGLILSLIHI